MASRLKDIIQGLKIYYSAPLAETFKKFRAGLIYFSVGLVIIYLAQTSLQSSLKQEIVTLFGLIMAAIGFFIAMTAQMKMIISRVVSFFTKK